MAAKHDTATSDYVEAGRELLPFLYPGHAKVLNARLDHVAEAARLFGLAVEGIELFLNIASYSAYKAWREVYLAERIVQRSDVIRSEYQDAAKTSRKTQQQMSDIAEQQQRVFDAAYEAWDNVFLTDDGEAYHARYLKRKPGRQYYADRFATKAIRLRATMMIEFGELDERIQIVRRGARSRLMELAVKQEEEQNRIMSLLQGRTG